MQTLETSLNALKDCRVPEEQWITATIGSINALAGLAIQGDHICRMISRAGGIQTLISICSDNGFRKIQGMSLRALAAVCSVEEGITQLCLVSFRLCFLIQQNNL